MAGKAGLKAGLIGGAIMLVLALLGLIPVPFLRDVCCCGVQLLAYAGIGVLAGFFLTPPRTAGTGAGAGAIAGVVSGVVAGVVGMLIAAIRMAIAGPGQMISTFDPEIMRQLAELGIGITPRMLATFSGWGGVAIGGSLCCLGWLVIGAALGAVGGAIFAATKSED